MATRVTPDEVKEIMDGLTATDSIIETFITAASAVIDQVFAGDTVISSTLLKELERWLTAHFIASTIFRMASEEKLGEAQMKYTGKWGENLASTSYGQTVKLLDITGKMSQVGKSAATIFAVTSFNTSAE
jgi:hypothetical protein